MLANLHNFQENRKDFIVFFCLFLYFSFFQAFDFDYLGFIKLGNLQCLETLFSSIFIE